MSSPRNADCPIRRLAIMSFVAVSIALCCFGRLAAAGPGLVAHWKFDEGSGAVAADSSGNGHDGAIHGATWQTDVAPVNGGSHSLYFDGSDDYVEVPDDGSLSGMSSLSVSCWFNATSFDPNPGEPCYLVSKDRQGDGSNATDSYGLTVAQIPGGIQVQAEIWSGSASGPGDSAQAAAVKPLQVDRWYHVAMTYDSSTLRLYLDGEEIASAAYDKTLNANTSVPLRTGQCSGPRTRLFHGLIDEVQVWDSVMPPPAPLVVVHVDDDAPGDPGPNDPAVSDPGENGTEAHPFDTIQEALNAAVSGVTETVLVQPGTYVENVNFNGKAITVTTTDPDSESIRDATVIDGNQAGTVVAFNHGEEADSVLTGFTIWNGRAPDGGGIYCSSSSPTITKNRIAGNSATGWQYSGGGGIYCAGACSPAITLNAIETNSAAQGGGIKCRYGASPEIDNNAITGNTAVYVGGGVGGYTNCSLTITNNSISDNQAGRQGGGIGCRESCSVTISDNTISANSAGWRGGAVLLTYGCSGLIEANAITENSAAGTTSGGGAGIFLYESSCSIANNDISNNSSSFGGGGIRVAEGSDILITDNKIKNNTASTSGGGICVSWSSPEIRGNEIVGNSAIGQGGGIDCGGGSSPTIAGNLISENRVTGPTTYAVGGGIRSGTDCRLEVINNTITNNSVTGGESSGGGMYCHYSEGIIQGNTITGNSAQGGGGIRCYHASPAIVGNTVNHNTGGGISLHTAHSIAITDNTVSSNTGGSGISLYASDSCEIRDNVISGNGVSYGAGVAVTHSGHVVLADNEISGNTTGGLWAGGGAAFSGSECQEITVSGNTFTGNISTWGGGLHLGGGAGVSGVISGNTFSGNVAKDNPSLWSGGGAITVADYTVGGAIDLRNASPTIRGNTITGNSAPVLPEWSVPGAAIYAGDGSSPVIEDNIVTGNECAGVVVQNGPPPFGDPPPPFGDPSSAIIRENTIGGNTAAGIIVRQTSQATLQSNSLAGNAGLGIDLGDDGPTPNDPGDADTGPSGLQNFPRLVSAVCDDGSTTVSGTLNSTANTTFTVEFFANAANDPSGYGEGETYLGSAEVMTDGTGNATFEVTPLVSVDSPELITSTATDPDGNTSEFSLNVNDPPVVVGVSGPTDPVSAGTTVYLEAEFTDPDIDDAHVAVWQWGDGQQETVTDAESPLSGIHSYGEPGVYAVSLTVTDIDGAQDQGVFEYVVVYDSSGGFVTGGGWIDSPSGAYVPDSSLAGKATFGFVSKYKKGADVPEGETVFRFHAADLSFHSTEYQWLVIAGPHAKFKGRGEINGEGDYGFMVTATDSDVQGGGDVDTFRIKITDGDVVYDNKIGEPDDSNAGTEIGGGNIVVHKAK